jgi:hypothetical protein
LIVMDLSMFDEDRRVSSACCLVVTSRSLLDLGRDQWWIYQRFRIFLDTTEGCDMPVVAFMHRNYHADLSSFLVQT